MDDGIRDIHNYPRKLARAIRHILSNNTVSNKNKLAILRFVSFVGVTEGRGLARQAFYAQHLERLAELLAKDFADANEDDIHAVVAKVNTMTVRSFKNNGAETTILKISDWTKEGYKITLKKFYRWLRKKHRGQYVDETGWIQVRKIGSKIKASDLLSPQDILQLLRTKRAQHPRNRAFILLTFESGGRPIEILNLKVANVSFDKYGAKVTLCGKKVEGERISRPIRVVYSAQALASWLSMHPARDNPDAPLFTSLSSSSPLEPLSYDRARLLLRLIAKDADVTKRVNPYNFRHSILTRLACSKQLSDSEVREFGGWSQSTRMFATYVHISNEHLDRRILEANEIIPKEENPILFEKNTCPRCGALYPPDIDFCSICGMAMKAKAAVNAEQIRNKADELLNRLFEDHQVRMYLLRRMKKLKLIPLLSELAPSGRESNEEERK